MGACVHTAGAEADEYEPKRNDRRTAGMKCKVCGIEMMILRQENGEPVFCCRNRDCARKGQEVKEGV